MNRAASTSTTPREYAAELYRHHPTWRGGAGEKAGSDAEAHPVAGAAQPECTCRRGNLHVRLRRLRGSRGLGQFVAAVDSGWERRTARDSGRMAFPIYLRGKTLAWPGHTRPVVVGLLLERHAVGDRGRPARHRLYLERRTRARRRRHGMDHLLNGT